MNRFNEIKNSAESMAYALIEQEYCASCPYCDSNGICHFVESKEEITMYMACYNAAIEWLKGDAQQDGQREATQAGERSER